MCDTPTVYRATAVIARKPHRCDECFRSIAVGELYEYVFGVWDDAGVYRTCAECVETRDELREMMEDGGGMYAEEIYCAIAHGQLSESLAEWCLECGR